MTTTPARRFLIENSPFYYPFGNTRIQNVLENANFNHQNDCPDDGLNVTKVTLSSGYISLISFRSC